MGALSDYRDKLYGTADTDETKSTKKPQTLAEYRADLYGYDKKPVSTPFKAQAQGRITDTGTDSRTWDERISDYNANQVKQYNKAKTEYDEYMKTPTGKYSQYTYAQLAEEEKNIPEQIRTLQGEVNQLLSPENRYKLDAKTDARINELNAQITTLEDNRAIIGSMKYDRKQSEEAARLAGLTLDGAAAALVEAERQLTAAKSMDTTNMTGAQKLERARQIDAAEKKLKAAEKDSIAVQNRAKYAAIPKAEDFDEYTQKDNVADIIALRDVPTAGTVNYRGDEVYLQYMSDSEKGIYNYLYNKDGEDAANEYLQSIKYELSKTRAATLTKQTAAFAEEYPHLSSVMSVLMRPAAAIQGAWSALDQTGKTGEINPYDAGFTDTMIREGIRQEVSKDMPGWGKFLYDTGMSMADFLSAMPLYAVPVVGQAAALGIMGMDVFQSTARDATLNGATAGQALTLGVIAGAAEVVTEKLGMERLFGFMDAADDGVKATLKNWLKQTVKGALPEMTEEVSTEIVNMLADQIVMGSQSEWNTMLASLLADGYSSSEARKILAGQFAGQVGAAAAGGLLSGAVMSGGASAIGAVQTNANYNKYINQSVAKYGKITATDENIKYITTNAKSGTEGYRLASKLDNNSTDADVAKAYVAITKDIVQEVINKYQSAEDKADIFSDFVEDEAYRNAILSGVNTEAFYQTFGAEDFRQLKLMAIEEQGTVDSLAQAQNMPSGDVSPEVGGMVGQDIQTSENGNVRAQNEPQNGDGIELDVVIAAYRTNPSKTNSDALRNAVANVPMQDLISNGEIVRARQRGTFNPGSEATNLIDTPERNAKREEVKYKILDMGSRRVIAVDGKQKNAYTGNVAQDKIAFIVIGQSAAGKSSAAANPLSERYNARIIDSDTAKEMLEPEFDGGYGAARVRVESDDIAEAVFETAADNGDNIIIPIVGKNTKVSKNRLAYLKLRDYKVYLVLNELNSEKAAKRAVTRFFEEGRFVDPLYVYEQGDKPAQTYKTLKEEGLFDGYLRLNNDVPFGQKARYVEGDYTLLEANGDAGGHRGREDVQTVGGIDGQGSNGTTETEVKAGEKPASSLPELSERGKTFRNRAAKSVVTGIANALKTKRNLLAPEVEQMVDYVVDEYLEKGAFDSENLDTLFVYAYGSAMVINDRAFNEFKPIRDYIRKQRIQITDTVREMGEFNEFRKENFGLLNLVNEKGRHTTELYEELSQDFPEYFPTDIWKQTEQLRHISEVMQSIKKTEQTLDTFYGENAKDFKEYARQKFYSVIDNAAQDLKNVRRYEAEKVKPEAKEYTLPELKEMLARRPALERIKANAESKVLLSVSDRLHLHRLLSGEINAKDIPQGANLSGIMEVYKASKELYDLNREHERYRAQYNESLFNEALDYVKNSAVWKDKINGLAYMTETAERNLRDIGKKDPDAENIVRDYINPIQESNADSVRFIKEYNAKVKVLGISEKNDIEVTIYDDVTRTRKIKRSEAWLVQYLGEAEARVADLESKRELTEDETKELGQKKTQAMAFRADLTPEQNAKINSAIESMRGIYEELFNIINDEMVRTGYNPIPYRKGYFPHFKDDSVDSGFLGKLAALVKIDINKDSLPTDIAGLTHTFRPGRKWFAHAQERTGDRTAYNALKGFDRYITGAADLIFQTENIKKLRALENAIRYTHSEEGVKEQVSEIKDRPNLTIEERTEAIEEALKRAKTDLPNLVTWLCDYTDLLAGKKSRMDRGAESAFGRNIYGIVKKFESRVAANMVGGNLASAFTNFIPMTQALAECSPVNLMMGLKDTITSYVQDDGFADRSTFLVNRRGYDTLYKTGAENVSKILSYPMFAIDNVASSTIVRAKYRQNIKAGMTEIEAMDNADEYASGLMAARSKGSMPTIFESRNPLIKPFTMFQLEVNNQLKYMFKDLPRHLRNKGAAAIAAAFLKMFVGGWLLNSLMELITGRRPAFDPIDMVSNFGQAWAKDGKITDGLETLAKDITDQVPFISGLVGGGRIPISAAIPDIGVLYDNAKALDEEDASKEAAWKNIGKEMLKPAYYLVPPAAGGQLKKTVEGISAVANKGSYIMNSNGEDELRFPVDPTVGNYIKGGLLGQYAIDTAQEYVSDGFKRLDAKSTTIYKGLIEDMSPTKAMKLVEGFREAKEVAEKRKYLRDTYMTAEQKALFIETKMMSDEQYEKYQGIIEAGADRDDAYQYYLAEPGENTLERVETLRGLDISEESKKAIYLNMLSASDSRNEATDKLISSGISMDTVLDITKKYAELDGTDKKAEEKNTELSKYLDSIGLTEEQRETALDGWSAGYYMKAGVSEYSESTLSPSNQKAWANTEVKTTFGNDVQKFLTVREIISNSTAVKGEYGKVIITAEKRAIDAIQKQLKVDESTATKMYRQAHSYKYEITDLSSKQQEQYEERFKGSVSAQAYIAMCNAIKGLTKTDDKKRAVHDALVSYGWSSNEAWGMSGRYMKYVG